MTPESAVRSISTVPLIALSGVTKSYSVEGRAVEALRGVNLEVERGTFLSVVGRSGCGKSTLLGILGGLDTPTAGRVVINGADIAQANDAALTRYRRATVGIVFQFFNLMPLLSVLENAALPALLAGKNRRETEARAEELVNRVGLSHRLHQQASLLSGGEMQRVAVARALINDPPLILADEPTGNLDSTSADAVLQVLRGLTTSGKTIVMVTHSREAAALADVSREMRDGRFIK